MNDYRLNRCRALASVQNICIRYYICHSELAVSYPDSDQTDDCTVQMSDDTLLSPHLLCC